MCQMTPHCPKQLPDDEYTGESQLPCGEYMRSLDFPMVSTPGSLNFLVFVISIGTGYTKWLVPITAGSHDSTVYSLKGSLDSLEYLASATVFCRLILVDFLGVFITGVSQTPQCIYHQGVTRRTYRRITPVILDKYLNPVLASLMGPWEINWFEKT
jgi:hypothetical protein